MSAKRIVPVERYLGPDYKLEHVSYWTPRDLRSIRRDLSDSGLSLRPTRSEAFDGSELGGIAYPVTDARDNEVGILYLNRKHQVLLLRNEAA